MGSKLKAFMAPATPSEKEEAKVTDQFLSCTGEDPGRDIYSLRPRPHEDDCKRKR